LVKDERKSLYYLFDLGVGKFKQPFIETGLNTYIFTQTISISLNLKPLNKN
jgi:hypothetical protein